MVIALNVASTAAIVCSAPAVLTHVLEMVSADDWDATTVTYSSDSVIASTGSISFATDGYQSSTTSSTLRYFNVSTAAALDIVNANIQLNSGKLSFRLKRYCSSGSTVYTTPFYGISFAGTVVGNTTYFSLSPSYVFFFFGGDAHAHRRLARSGSDTRHRMPEIFGCAGAVLQANDDGEHVQPACHLHGRCVRLQPWLHRQRRDVHPYVAQTLCTLVPALLLTPSLSARTGFVPRFP